MSKEEINNLLCLNWNNYFAPALTGIDNEIEKLHVEFYKGGEE